LTGVRSCGQADMKSTTCVPCVLITSMVAPVAAWAARPLRAAMTVDRSVTASSERGLLYLKLPGEHCVRQ
jgi:hypothetical protein